MALTTRKQALDYHSQGRPGKLEVVPTKPCLTQKDLSLAYSPGVAEPCLEIAKDPSKAFEYTARGNLIAVVTDGSAVLGLGNIGALAGKPVMEGKAVLFKRFADIDVFDIELGTQDVDEIVAAVKAISPTVSGINLEDISAPRCFEIERRLTEELDIPVFHDDQHGTALITGAALINALEIAGKKLADVRVVVNGAGAAAVACVNLATSLGVEPENVMMCDSKGVLYEGRTEGLNEYKAPFLRKTDCRTLADAMKGADVFIGVSVGNVVDADMLRSMAANPVVLAMANPDPEIDYPVAIAARPDVIMATGRSDYPNQVNNVLGFPYVFRGALDVQASCINGEMLLAATHALAQLAKEPVPEGVARAYGLELIEFGRDYFVPKPLDHRVIRRVATAVAQAAIETGVARRPIDMEAYVRKLGERLGEERDLMDTLVTRASKSPRRIGYPEGEDEKSIIAAEAVVQEHIAVPVLIGNDTRIHALAAKIGVSLEGVEVIDPDRSPQLASYGEELARIRSHRGRTLDEAMEMIADPTFFGCMMLRQGDIDGLVCGVTRQVRKTMPPILKVVPLRAGVRRAASMTMAFTRRGTVFLADTAVNIEPSAEDLAEIAILAADEVRYLGIEPVVAMLSFSSYGGTRHARSDMVRHAVEIARQEAPDLLIDGEMRLDCAIDPTVQARYPGSRLGGRKANVLVFPNLEAANIGFNMMRYYADASLVGPIMLGLERPAHMLQPHSAGVSDMVRLTAIAVLDARRAEASLEVGV